MKSHHCTGRMLFLLSVTLPLSAFALHGENTEQITKLIQIVAPLEQEYNVGDDMIHVRGYSVKIKKSTRFRDYDKSDLAQYISQPSGDADRAPDVTPGFTLEKGQWLKIAAKYNSEGVLLADKITKTRKNVFKFTEKEKKKILPNMGDRNYLHPFKRLMEDDAAPGLGFHLSDQFLVGGTLELNNQWEDERDLDRKAKKDKDNQRAVFKLSSVWRLNKSDLVFIEPSYQTNKVNSEDDGIESRSNAKLNRGYFYNELNDSLAIHAGRMNFDDEREWLYDEVLDAVRLYLYRGHWLLDISTGTGRDELDVPNQTQGIRNTMVDLRYILENRHFFSLWSIQREDEDPAGFSPKLTGARYYHRQSKGINLWLEAAQSSGKINNQDIDGYAYDIGINYKTRRRPRQYYFASIAYASGVEGNSQDTAFRQSGLQGNSAKFGGVSSYKYYGEVIRPELSNRIITTVGFGTRPQKRFSFDIVYHNYRQVELSTDLGDTKIKADANGLSTDIGDAIELIFAYRTKKMKLEIITGTFFPGDAFNDGVDFNQRDTAHRTEISLDLKF